MRLGEGQNAVTQIIAVANILDPDHARQSFSVDFEAFWDKWVQ